MWYQIYIIIQHLYQYTNSLRTTKLGTKIQTLPPSDKVPPTWPQHPAHQPCLGNCKATPVKKYGPRQLYMNVTCCWATPQT